MRSRILGISFMLTLGLSAQPQYYAGISASYNYTDASKLASTDLGIRLGTSSMYSFSSIDLAHKTGTVRTGLAKVLTSGGNLSLVAWANAGVTAGSGTALGALGTGLFVLFDLGQALKLGNHLYLSLGERIVNVTSQTVNPAFTVGIGIGL